MKKIFGILLLLVVFCLVFSNIVIAPVPDQVPPIAILDWSPEYPMALETVTFDGCDSYDPGGGPITKWLFNFGDDETAEITECTITHEYANNGVYTVSLKVWDDEGDTDIVTEQITVGNNHPEADFTYTPSNPSTADTIQFTDTSTDIDGTVIAWSWNFGDSHTSNIQNPNHQYNHAGTYTVTLIVIDDDGDTDDKSKQITVTNIPPVADPGGPYECECYTPLQLDGSLSDDTDGEIIEYLWDLGDGHTAIGPYPTHTYTVEDVYTISLTVIDDEGDSDTETTTATITESEVDVDAGGPYTGETGIPILFTGSASDGTPPYSWYWDFKDGNTSNEQNPNHAYSLPGGYNVMLTVTDNLGMIGWDTAEVNINPSPLMVDAGGPYTGTINTPVQFTSTINGGYIPYTFDWDFGDDITHSSESNPVHQYTQVGTYTVTLSVEDDTGNTMSDTATVNVLESIPDLECEQGLNWNEVKPGITIDGVILVKNDGEPQSKLNWEVSSYPEWGTWTFNPSEGTGLTPEDDMINVVVTLVTPKTKSISSMYKLYKIKSEDFIGNITIINKDNASDIEVMPVSITVSKSKALVFLDYFYRYFIFRFPFLNKILNQIL